MFQNLTQGAFLPILYKNTPRVVDGKVISVSTHMPAFNPQQPLAMMNGPVTDITVQVGNETIPFAGLPANGIVANFPDKGIFVSTDRNAVLREIEAMAAASKQILESVPTHEKMVRDCEDLILQLNPERKKEAQAAEEMSALQGEVRELKEMLSALLKQDKEK